MSNIASYLKKMYLIFDGLDEAGIGIESFKPSLGVKKSSEVVQSDLTIFSLYLAASDREISYWEKDFISGNLDVNFTIDDMKDIIKKRNIRSTEYEQAVPLSVQMMVNADNIIVSRGNNSANGSLILYGMFKNVGQSLLACDGEVADKEIEDLARYLDMIKEYVNKHTLSSARIDTKPASDASAAKKLLKEIKPEYQSTVTRPLYETVKRGSDNPTDPAPWDTVYYNYPCPYCGKYKVRPSKWEDKMWSTAFWGFYNYKLHSRFKCDACKEMWN